MTVDEFKQKYPFVIKEVKIDGLVLCEFDSFINSKEWNSYDDEGKFELIEILENLHNTNIQPYYNTENFQKFNRFIEDFLSFKPIDINKFKNPFISFLVEKIENKIIYLNEYAYIINSDNWKNLKYEYQKEIIETIQNKLYDQEKKKDTEYYLELNKHIYKDMMPEIIINCNYVSKKWNDLYYIYINFENTIDSKPKTKQEQIEFFRRVLINLKEENRVEYIGLIKKIENELFIIETDDNKKTDHQDKKEKVMKLPKKTDFNETILTQKQTSLFAYFIRKNKLILPNTSDMLLADCFGKMTGYSSTQINKNYRGITDISDISENKKDYEILIQNLKKIITDIETFLIENEKTNIFK